MERAAALERFVGSYAGAEAPPWVVGGPQPAVVGLVEGGGISGRVLDVGTGVGEHTILLARHGFEVVGVDFVPAAVELARRRAAAEGVQARFEVVDVLGEPGLVGVFGEFDTVLDSALFHNFDGEDRQRYVEVLRRVLRPGGRIILLALAGGGGLGPEVSDEELVAPFRGGGWKVEEISQSTYVGTVRHERHMERFGLPLGSTVTVPAWLASVRAA
jgi:SAM-dependent methyltransferase